MATKIQWCDESVNPIIGCSHASAGCKNCFAERQARRLGWMLPPGQTRDAYRSVIGEDGKWNGKTAVVPSGMDRLRKLANARKPRRVFVGSMTDIFHEAVDQMRVWQVFQYMSNAPQHTFLLLTKRPEYIAAWLYGVQDGEGTTWGIAPEKFPHVWLGVTAENQEQFDKRVPMICDPSSPSYWPGKKFVSIEPQLSAINCGAWLGPQKQEAYRVYGMTFTGDGISFDGDKGVEVNGAGLSAFSVTKPGFGGIEWVVNGCESGPKRRPAEADWFRSLRDQCKAAGVAYVLKQMEVVYVCPVCAGTSGSEYGPGCRKCGGLGFVFRREEMPQLDGRQWAEVPEGMPT